MDFDKKAQSWDNESRIKKAVIISNEIKKHINLSNSWGALEFGAGTGLISLNLTDEFNSIKMIDSSAKMIEILKKKIPDNMKYKLHASNDNIETLIHNKEKFNIIYTSMVLHHIIDTPDIISKFSKLLYKNGYLCIIDLNTEDGSFHKNDIDFNGYNGFDQNDLKNIFESNGFINTVSHTFLKENKNIGDIIFEYSLFILYGQTQ